MTDIKERARRVTISIEEARAAAVRLGDRNGTAIGEDAYELAKHVLEQEEVKAQHRVLTARISALQSTIASIEHEASQALRGAPRETPFEAPHRCLCQLPGPGRSMQCGVSCEYDLACNCDCHLPTSPALSAKEQDADEHWIEKRGPLRDEELKAGGHEPPVDPAHPSQMVVPGTIEDDARLANASKAVPSGDSIPPIPVGPKTRTPEVETPVESWEPPTGLLLELGAAYGNEWVTARVIEFRKVHAGKSAKRWAPTLRTWLAAQKA